MGNKAEMLQSEYRIRFSVIEEYRNCVWKILCEQFFQKFVPADGNILDLGAGWCEFINNIKAARKFAMDLNPETGRRLSEPAVFFCQDCSQEWPVPQESLDVVFTSNFLEHLPDKGHVEKTMTEAYRCLKMGGLIICLGPNIKFVPGEYWDFWDHSIPITDLSLSELLKLKGFAVQKNIPRFLPFSMSTGKVPPLFLVKLYMRLPFLWPLFGKQFLVIGRKDLNNE